MLKLIPKFDITFLSTLFLSLINKITLFFLKKIFLNKLIKDSEKLHMFAFIFQPRDLWKLCSVQRLKARRRMEASNVSEIKGSVISQKGQFRGIRIENPFTLKVGQIFTGFGVGCGVGIGVGRPINMGRTFFPPLSTFFCLYQFLSLAFSFALTDQV